MANGELYKELESVKRKGYIIKLSGEKIITNNKYMVSIGLVKGMYMALDTYIQDGAWIGLFLSPNVRAIFGNRELKPYPPLEENDQDVMQGPTNVKLMRGEALYVVPDQSIPDSYKISVMEFNRGNSVTIQLSIPEKAQLSQEQLLQITSSANALRAIGVPLKNIQGHRRFSLLRAAK